ncbi:MAG: glycosyl hydrolase family 8, partial [Acidimicrobiales bacterium]
MTPRCPMPALVAVVTAAAALGALLVTCGRDGSRGDADAFFEGYMDGDGRVVRRDQGGDTVSEGQAYAMLLAAAHGDRGRFDRAWQWARDHLQRHDGLLSWRWRDGRVVDPSPAADADVDAARARVVQTWKECARIARDHGVELSWEFEPGFAFNRPSDVIRIVQEIGEPNFGAMFDTCHAYTVGVVGAKQTGGPQETVPGGVLGFAKKLRGRINHIQ